MDAAFEGSMAMTHEELLEELENFCRGPRPALDDGTLRPFGGYFELEKEWASQFQLDDVPGLMEVLLHPKGEHGTKGTIVSIALTGALTNAGQDALLSVLLPYLRHRRIVVALWTFLATLPDPAVLDAINALLKEPDWEDRDLAAVAVLLNDIGLIDAMPILACIRDQSAAGSKAWTEAERGLAWFAQLNRE